MCSSDLLTCGASGLSGGAPDRSCRLSSAPTARPLSSTRTGAHLMRCSRPLRANSRCSTGTPDSPVNYRGAPSDFPEGGEFSVECPGAPDTVRCARLECLLGCLLLSLFEPFLGLFIGFL